MEQAPAEIGGGGCRDPVEREALLSLAAALPGPDPQRHQAQQPVDGRRRDIDRPHAVQGSGDDPLVEQPMAYLDPRVGDPVARREVPSQPEPHRDRETEQSPEPAAFTGPAEDDDADEDRQEPPDLADRMD